MVKEFAEVKDPGLIDVVTQLMGLTNIMNNLNWVNPIKFKLMFNHTMKLFIWQYSKLVDFSNTLKPDVVKNIKDSTDSLTEVMSQLPMAVTEMTTMFSSVGRKRRLVRKGINVFIGDDGLIAIMTRIGKDLVNTINLDDAMTFSKSAENVSKSIRKLVRTFNIAAITAPLTMLGAYVIFGSSDKNSKWKGVLGMVATGLTNFAANSKNIKEGGEALLYISLVVGILALTAVLMSMVGLFIIKSWKSIAVVGIFMAALIFIFFVIGRSDRIIKEGTKELLYIAATVGILALTAVVVALLGQFIHANWKSILQVGVMMGFLLLGFMVIGFFANPINSGIKELMYVALTVGVIALIAVILVFISNYIKGNWEGILQIGTMLLFICAPIVAIGLMHRQLEQGKKSMLLMIGCVIALTISIMLLAHIANTTDLLMLTWAAGIMVGIILVIFGLMVALVAMASSGFGAVALAVGAAVMMAISAVMVSMGVALMAIAESVAIIDRLGIDDPKELAKKVMLPIEAAMVAVGALCMIPLPMIMIASANAVTLATVMISIGIIAKILQKIASLSIPDPAAGFDSKGNPKGYIQMTGEDFANAAMNANGILAVCAGMFDDSQNGNEVEFADGSKAKITTVSMNGIMAVTGQVKRKIRKLSKIMKYVGNIAVTLQKLSSLVVPDPAAGFDKDGNPKGYLIMQGQQFADACMNANGILMAASSMFATPKDDGSPIDVIFKGQDGEITAHIQPISLGALENIDGRVKRKIKKLGQIISVVGGMANTIQFMASMRIPTAWDESGNPTSFSPMKNPEDLEKAMENIKLIMTHIVDCMTSDDLANKLDNLSKRNSKKLANAMSSISGISSMADLISKLAGGQIPTKYTYDPETKQNIPGGFVNFSEYINKHKDDLRKNIENIYSIVTEAIINVCGSKEQIKRLEKVKTGMDLINKVMNPMFGMVKTTTEVYTKVAELPGQTELSETMGRGTWMIRHTCWALGDTKRILDEAGIPSLNTAKDYLTIIGDGKTGMLYRYKSMMEIYKNDFSSMDSNAFKERWSAATGTMEIMFGIYNNSVKLDVINGIQKNITETISLVKTIGGVDTNKLKYAATLMYSLNKVSQSIKGNFQGLAKVINEQLITALEKLQEVMKEIQTNGINVNSRPAVNPTAPGNNAGNGGSGLLDKIKDKFAGNNDNIQSPDEIVDKLDEILSIIEGFTDGYGNNRKVRTT